MHLQEVRPGMNADYFLASIAFGLLAHAVRQAADENRVGDLQPFAATVVALFIIALSLAILGFFL